MARSLTRLTFSFVVAMVSTVSTASATTTIKAFLGGPFSAGNPVGTLPATVLSIGNTYDFTFAIVTPVEINVVTSVGAAAATSIDQGLPLQFSLYSGSPTHAHTLIDTSAYIINPVLDDNFETGSYYVQVSSPGIYTSGETGSGSITVAEVPEPAVWSLLVGGFALVGAAARYRSRAVAV